LKVAPPPIWKVLPPVKVNREDLLTTPFPVTEREVPSSVILTGPWRSRLEACTWTPPTRKPPERVAVPALILDPPMKAPVKVRVPMLPPWMVALPPVPWKVVHAREPKV